MMSSALPPLHSSHFPPHCPSQLPYQSASPASIGSNTPPNTSSTTTTTASTDLSKSAMPPLELPQTHSSLPSGSSSTARSAPPSAPSTTTSSDQSASSAHTTPSTRVKQPPDNSEFVRWVTEGATDTAVPPPSHHPPLPSTAASSTTTTTASGRSSNSSTPTTESSTWSPASSSVASPYSTDSNPSIAQQERLQRQTRTAQRRGSKQQSNRNAPIGLLPIDSKWKKEEDEGWDEETEQQQQSNTAATTAANTRFQPPPTTAAATPTGPLDEKLRIRLIEWATAMNIPKSMWPAALAEGTNTAAQSVAHPSSHLPPVHPSTSVASAASSRRTPPSAATASSSSFPFDIHITIESDERYDGAAPSSKKRSNESKGRGGKAKSIAHNKRVLVSRAAGSGYVSPVSTDAAKLLLGFDASASGSSNQHSEEEYEEEEDESPLTSPLINPTTTTRSGRKVNSTNRYRDVSDKRTASHSKRRASGRGTMPHAQKRSRMVEEEQAAPTHTPHSEQSPAAPAAHDEPFDSEQSSEESEEEDEHDPTVPDSNRSTGRTGHPTPPGSLLIGAATLPSALEFSRRARSTGAMPVHVPVLPSDALFASTMPKAQPMVRAVSSSTPNDALDGLLAIMKPNT